jgi:hypothetical protein
MSRRSPSLRLADERELRPALRTKGQPDACTVRRKARIVCERFTGFGRRRSISRLGPIQTSPAPESRSFRCQGYAALLTWGGALARCIIRPRRRATRSRHSLHYYARAMRSLLDFSSWQGVLSTLVGLVLVTVIAVGIRLVVMQRVQHCRERQNRQLNERLRTLIAAYRTLGGPLYRSCCRAVHGNGRCGATVGGASQPGAGPVRHRGRAFIRIATLFAPRVASHPAPGPRFHARGRGWGIMGG